MKIKIEWNKGKNKKKWQLIKLKGGKTLPLPFILNYRNKIQKIATNIYGAFLLIHKANKRNTLIQENEIIFKQSNNLPKHSFTCILVSMLTDQAKDALLDVARKRITNHIAEYEDTFYPIPFEELETKQGAFVTLKI